MEPVLILERDSRIAITVAKSLEPLGLTLQSIANINDLNGFICRYDVSAIIAGPSESKLAICRQLRAISQANTPVLTYGPRETLERRVCAARLRSNCVRLLEQSPAILHLAAGVTLDTPSQTLSYLSDVRISIGRAECAILTMLASSKGNTLYKSDLVHRLWGRNDRRVNRSLDVHIHGLRQKLAATSLPIDIESVRGRGFKLRPRFFAKAEFSPDRGAHDGSVQIHEAHSVAL